MPHHPPHNGPRGPHHHDPPHHHRPARRGVGRSSQYPEQVVGPIGRLLDKADDFDDLKELEDLIEKRHSTDFKYFESAIDGIKEAGRDPSVKMVLRVMADMKAIEWYSRDRMAALQNTHAGDVGNANGGGTHAVILPIPPHSSYLIDEASVGMIFVLPNHHVPHHLDDLEVADLPSRARKVKEVFASVTNLTFEGVVDRKGAVSTRREIVDLLADLADAGIKPSLRVQIMPHIPHHESFEEIEGAYDVESFD
jgi:hypothetical protein